MKTFTLEIPDYYENGGICVVLMTANGQHGIDATDALMDLQKNQEMYVDDKKCLQVRDREVRR